VLDFVYDDFVGNDFVTEAPPSCDFVEGDFTLGDFQICVTPSTDSGTGGIISPRFTFGTYRGSTVPPFEIRYKPRPEPEHIVIEEEPQKITDTLEERINALVITKPEPIPIYIDFIPVRKTIQKVKLVEDKPKPEYIPKPDIIRGPDKKKAALRKKLEKLKMLLDLTYLEHYI